MLEMRAQKRVVFWIGSILLVAALCVADASDSEAEAAPKSSKVKVLTDENFEHLTQSVTGATTGNWFVEFYAPWCGHCKNLEPTWEKLADKMAENRDMGEPTAVIAKVDGTASRYLSGRFKIQGFPTLHMFSQGKMYQYKGQRTLDDMIEFAAGGFAKAESEPVPKGPNELSPLEKVWYLFEVTIKRDMDSIWEFHKAAFFLSMGCTLAIGLLLGAVCSRRAPAPVAQGKPKRS